MATKKATHKHRVSSITTRAGTGVYVDHCRCGATRKRTYRGEGELNVKIDIAAWAMPKRRPAKRKRAPSRSRASDS